MHDDVDRNIVGAIVAIIDGNRGSHYELAVNLRGVIDKKRECHKILTLLHVNGEEAPLIEEILPETYPFCVAGSKGLLAGWLVSGVDQAATVKHVRNRVASVRIVRMRMFVPSIIPRSGMLFRWRESCQGRARQENFGKDQRMS